MTTELRCPKCGKTYVRQHAYDKHVKKCKGNATEGQPTWMMSVDEQMKGREESGSLTKHGVTSPNYLTKHPQAAVSAVIDNDYNKQTSNSERVLVYPCSVKELHDYFGKHFHMTEKDHVLLDIVLSSTLDRDIPGDPIWLYVVAPSGGWKTELLRSLSRYPRVYTLSSLTTRTFISGKWITIPGSKTKENPKGTQVLGGILYSLDGRVLIFKDFTVILGMRDTDRYEIYAQLRDIYDGYHEKGFGTSHVAIRVKATIGCILGVTPVIDAHQKCHTTMGERFLKVRSHPDPKLTTKRAHENLGKMDEIRTGAQEIVFNFLSGLSFDNLPEPSEDQREEINKMARYIALMRAWVHASTWRGKIINMTLPEPEVPTRVVKQLGKMAIALALVRGHDLVTEQDVDTLRRIARDTALPLRQKIVSAMVKDERAFTDGGTITEFTYYSVSQSSKAHYNSVRIEVDKMVALGILDAETEITPKGEVIVVKFGFHEDFRELVEAVLPRMAPAKEVF